MESLNKKVFNGAVTMVLLRFVIKFLGLISTLVLARLITPEDFGLVAIVMSIYALIEMLKAFGFDVVLIQKDNPSDAMYNTTWTIQLAFGIIASGIMYLISPYIASTFDDHRLEALSQVIALLFLINGTVNIGVVNFRKELNFRREFIYMSLPKVFAVITTITVAIIHRSYWALICGMLVSNISQAALSYIFSKYRPKFCLSEVSELFSFSSWLLIGNLLTYANVRAKDLLVGKLLGAKYTGLISVADEIASLPTTEMVAAINRATYPGYTKVAHDNKALKALFLNALSFIAVLGVPASVGMSLCAPYLVPVVLGDKWLEVTPLIQILGLAYAVICINTNASYIFLARGKPKVNALVNLARAIILLSLMLILIPVFGIIGLPFALLTTALAMFPTYFYLLKKEINLSFYEYTSTLWRPLLSSIIMFLTTHWLFWGVSIEPVIDVETVSLLDFISIIFVGAIIYLVAVTFLWLI
ncbi:MAG: lipopolysaccharide biosynthesis protein, partial [Colwellia sp.]|nr:lipopolysaccharide biosynthesis protein [Colwellia sp.]